MQRISNHLLSAMKFLLFEKFRSSRRCSVKRVLLKISHSLQENPCPRVSFLTSFKKRFWHRCFSVNFAKFLRAPFFIEHLRWLLLRLYHFQREFDSSQVYLNLIFDTENFMYVSFREIPSELKFRVILIGIYYKNFKNE